ncbi:hypothetical protein A4A49_32340 [Nicotiana attenuata]|uniref:Uncharacterized protein n=1 Tax=Nicotiana attenuata TaxID=49451 RepID=A0A1J6K532_NICAT|nr:hypothetical protein A4A49_32340 [Nicotiana attenuata]
MDWVQRRFGTPKEVLNVITNHSCQEIPSHTVGGSSRAVDTMGTKIDGSSKGIGTTDATSNRCTLWGEEVEKMELNNAADAHSSDQTKQPGTVDSQAIVNSRMQETRVKVLDQTIVQNTTKSIGVGTRSLIEARINEGAGEEAIGKEKDNGTINPSSTAKGFSIAAAHAMDGNGVRHVNKAPTMVLDDTVRSNTKTTNGKPKESNGTIILVSTIRGLKEVTRVSREQAIVPKASGAIKALPMACALRTRQPMQLQINVPLKSPNQLLHEIITHNVAPMDLQNVEVEQGKIKEEGEDESIAGNFKVVARDAGLSPRVTGRSGKQGKKKGQFKEVP